MHLLAIESKCQDAQFSQFDNSPLSINPAFAGAFNGDIRLLANYRNQWSVSAPYNTFAFSCDMGIMKRKGKTGYLGAGISFLSDKAGSSALGLNQANLLVAYHEYISDHNTISAGIIGGFAQRSIDFSKLEWNSQYNTSTNNFDPTLPSYETNYSQNKSYPDFGTGLQWAYTKGERNEITNDELNLNAGIAVFHVNKPNVSFYSSAKDNLPRKLELYGNSLIGFQNSKYALTASFLYSQQGAANDVILGGLLRIKLQQESRHTGFIKGNTLAFGGYYHIGEAIIPEVQLEIADYALGMSYDINSSGIRYASSYLGAFEISLSCINPNIFAKKPAQNKTLIHSEE
jgi:type IX secretion system PorP/SprF family membrane protein